MQTSVSKLGNYLSADKPIQLSSLDDTIFFGRGWSQREVQFCWTLGNFSELSLDTDGSPGSINIDCAPFMCESIHGNQVLIFANGLLVCAEFLKGRGILSFEIEKGISKVDLLFWCPNAVAPADVDEISMDTRKLGIQLFGITRTNDTTDTK